MYHYWLSISIPQAHTQATSVFLLPWQVGSSGREAAQPLALAASPHAAIANAGRGKEYSRLIAGAVGVEGGEALGASQELREQATVQPTAWPPVPIATSEKLPTHC